MTQRIGKYEIQTRVGRGGMGMVFMARDPALDRLVAIKVISDDGEVDEDIRARFFREAKACAKLGHPNIVTIYEMGEDDGRLYIAMEFLEGDELRRVISERRYAAIEDKVTLMCQICDGLYYAHTRGVVHRDIKPSNIMVLRDGVAKIVDFGIAQVAALGAGRTRTGSLLGTLRYMAPEQLEGHADARSDMFSVGSVFYELLAHRPAFTASDHGELFAALRSAEPPALGDLDPGIPATLSAVIARAMRKDPTDRFADLREMRLALEDVQGALAVAAAEARRRIGAQLERAVRLREAVVERVGAGAAACQFPLVDEQARLHALRAAEGEIAAQADRLAQVLAAADALSPRLARGLAHAAEERYAAAIADLEAVLAELPEHEGAAEALRDVRAREAEARRRRRIVARIDDARAALAQGEHRRCLEILAEIEEPAARLELRDEVERARGDAEAGIAAAEAAREERERQRSAAEAAAREALAREESARRRAEAEAAAAACHRAREAAEAARASGRSTALWQAAESRAAAAREAAAAQAYARATRLFAEAAGFYAESERAAEIARRQEQRRAEEALDRAGQRRAEADAADAGRWAEAPWAAGERTLADGRTALSAGDLARAVERFEDAGVLYRRAADVAEAAVLREREQAAAAQEAAHREEQARARAEALRRAAESSAREAVRRDERAGAERAREAMVAARARAVEQNVARRGRAEWGRAESKAAAGLAAMGRDEHARAADAFAEAAALFERSAALAREAMGTARPGRALRAAPAGAEDAPLASPVASDGARGIAAGADAARGDEGRAREPSVDAAPAEDAPAEATVVVPGSAERAARPARLVVALAVIVLLALLAAGLWLLAARPSPRSRTEAAPRAGIGGVSGEPIGAKNAVVNGT